MASVTSNLDSAIAPLLRGLGRLLDVSRPHGKRRLGDEMADVVAAGIQARTLDRQQAPGGGEIAANRGRYGIRKRRRGVRVGVGLYGEDVGGEMLQFENIRGQVAMNEDTVSMTAGLDAEAQDKIEWFTEGNPATGQPPRPFYELDDQIESDLTDLMAEAADSRLRDLGAE